MIRSTAFLAALALALAALALALAAHAEDVAAPLTVKQLFSNPRYSRPAISDDGQTIAVNMSQGDVQVILTRPVAGGSPKAVAKLDDPDTRLRWLEWANASRLLYSVEARNPITRGVRGRVTRLYGVDADGKNSDWLGKRWPYLGQLQVQPFFQDHIVHWTPDDPDFVLIGFRSPYEEWPRVMKLNVNTGALRPHHAARRMVHEWMADKNGDIRAGIAIRQDERYELYTRVDAEGEFELAIQKDFFATTEEFAGFHSDDPSKIFVSRDLDGRSAIYEFDLRAKQLGTLVFAHPEVDVDDLIHAPGGDGRVIGVRYTTDSPQLHFIDAAAGREHASLRAALEQEFGAAVQVFPTSASRDENRQVLHVSSDTQPPKYFGYDRALKQLFPLIDQHPDVRREQLSETRRVTYQARDGLSIPAYLTLPRGLEAKNLPLVMLVHGGPWARDAIRWNPEVQLFASRGFAVLQPNFRGSTGLGTKHLEAGYREWGGKIQDDITDGVKWAVAQGIADADRVGIYGVSFGGYATLAGLALKPELYRAGAAYAPVTDIEFLLKDDQWYDWGYDWHETMVGGERGDAERLRAASPLRNAAKIRAPVLLGHGVDDQRVHVRQSQRMAEALAKAGKPHEYLEFPDEIHGFVLEANRIRWYEALIAFFEKNLAKRANATAEPAAN